jgi:hypothetical protein
MLSAIVGERVEEPREETSSLGFLVLRRTDHTANQHDCIKCETSFETTARRVTFGGVAGELSLASPSLAGAVVAPAASTGLLPSSAVAAGAAASPSPATFTTCSSAVVVVAGSAAGAATTGAVSCGSVARVQPVS